MFYSNTHVTRQDGSRDEGRRLYRLKSQLADLCSTEEIAAAKKTPDIWDGRCKIRHSLEIYAYAARDIYAMNIDDMPLIIGILNEAKQLGNLPTFVLSIPDKMPSLRLA